MSSRPLVEVFKREVDILPQGRKDVKEMHRRENIIALLKTEFEKRRGLFRALDFARVSLNDGEVSREVQ